MTTKSTQEVRDYLQQQSYEDLVHYQYKRLITELRRVANILENPVAHSFVEPADEEDLIDVLDDGQSVEANLKFLEDSINRLERNSYSRKR